MDSRRQRITPRQAPEKRPLDMPGCGHPGQKQRLGPNPRAFGNGDNHALPGLIGLRMGNRQPEPFGPDTDMLDLERDDFGPRQRGYHADRQDRPIAQRPETVAVDRSEHVAQRRGVCRTLLAFGRPVFRANAGQHFGQTPGRRHCGRRRIPACSMMMPDRSHPPVDGRRVQPGGGLIASKDRDGVRRCRQRRRAVLRAPSREDRPIGRIRAPRRLGAGRLCVGGSPFDLAVKAGWQHRLIRTSRHRHCR